MRTASESKCDKNGPDPTVAARMVLHVGASRTATTTLQSNVFAGLSDIVFLGKPFLHKRDVRLGIISSEESLAVSMALYNCLGEGEVPNIAENRVVARAIIDRLRKSTAFLVVLSEEAMCNNKAVPFAVIASRLEAMVGSADIMLTIRNQLSVIPSLFQHEMRKAEKRMMFEDWFDMVFSDPKGRTLRETIEQYRYCELLGAFQVGIWGANWHFPL